ncbi:site-2 protease family protein [Niabella ginsengisoli]|uniref:Peptidase M50 domain-containing protein n=1 Tax=Niabella ginsengisoli TaxID=522298 RepID=A0ABS9SQW2_9BACT|nr:site-2 protease family protein [Niabella ginsengisoli]MCH5600757.1 hypothetical protein [Niabella ginsengisoli]
MRITEPDRSFQEPSIISAYPPKHHLEPADSRQLLLKGLYSVVLYLGLGYLLLKRWDLLLVIFGIIILHEAGHFLAMKYYNYADVSVLFLPFIGAFVKGSKKEVSQKQSAVILLAGPLPGIMLGIIIHFLNNGNQSNYIGGVPLQLVAQLLIWANLLNLLPLYPLDGGQLLNRVFLNEEGRLSNIFIFLSIAVIACFAINIKFYILLAFPALLVYRFFSARSSTKLEKQIDQSGIDVDKNFEDLTDEEYWKLRSIVIKHTPAFQQVAAGPPFVYDDKETRIATEVDSVLQRNLLMDISVVQKLLVLFIWALFILLPYLLNIDFLLIRYLYR